MGSRPVCSGGFRAAHEDRDEFVALGNSCWDLSAIARPPHSPSPLPGPGQLVPLKSNFSSNHPGRNPVILPFFPFSPECSALAFCTFRISRSIIFCCTFHSAGSASVLPAWIELTQPFKMSPPLSPRDSPVRTASSAVTRSGLTRWRAHRSPRMEGLGRRNSMRRWMPSLSD